MSQLSYSLGHSYHSTSNPPLGDIMLGVARGLAPRDRQPPLGNEQQIAGLRHWEFVRVLE